MESVLNWSALRHIEGHRALDELSHFLQKKSALDEKYAADLSALAAERPFSANSASRLIQSFKSGGGASTEAAVDVGSVRDLFEQLVASVQDRAEQIKQQAHLCKTSRGELLEALALYNSSSSVLHRRGNELWRDVQTQARALQAATVSAESSDDTAAGGDAVQAATDGLQAAAAEYGEKIGPEVLSALRAAEVQRVDCFKRTVAKVLSGEGMFTCYSPAHAHPADAEALLQWQQRATNQLSTGVDLIDAERYCDDEVVRFARDYHAPARSKEADGDVAVVEWAVDEASGARVARARLREADGDRTGGDAGAQESAAGVLGRTRAMMKGWRGMSPFKRSSTVSTSATAATAAPVPAGDTADNAPPTTPPSKARLRAVSEMVTPSPTLAVPASGAAQRRADTDASGRSTPEWMAHLESDSGSEDHQQSTTRTRDLPAAVTTTGAGSDGSSPPPMTTKEATAAGTRLSTSLPAVGNSFGDRAPPPSVLLVPTDSRRERRKSFTVTVTSTFTGIRRHSSTDAAIAGRASAEPLDASALVGADSGGEVRRAASVDVGGGAGGDVSLEESHSSSHVSPAKSTGEANSGDAATPPPTSSTSDAPAHDERAKDLVDIEF